MRCPRCGQENPADAGFCMQCGSALASACASCGTPLPAGAKFCPQCGRPVGVGAAQPRFASPGAYTPEHLAERILTTRGALEGERKQVTVLFADLKGSMELLADRDPEEARKILDPVLERMMEAVHLYEGTVNQVMGDGIMALFGAPLAHEDHAVRACYAALRMQESVSAYGDEMQRAHGIPVQIRVGLNSGEVVVRAIGSDLRMDYTAVGQTTHLAARMEQMAKPGSILATANTLRLAEGYIVVKPLGPVPVKGLEGPVDVYEVVAVGAARSRLQASAARGLTRFVGRQAELDVLRGALEKAREGHGEIVALVGEAGVGKSRLFWEFTRSRHTKGWLVLESRSVSYGKATAYAPVVDLLRAYFEIDARDDGRKIREKVTGKLLTLDKALEPTLPAFLALLDVSSDDAEWRELEPAQRRQRTLDAVRGLFFRESQVQPVLIVFEDLHWIDAETQAVLDGAIARLNTARLLLLVNYRPEYRHGWGGRRNYTQLRIDPLPLETAEELLDALLGEDPGLRPLKKRLIEHTEGNPFFLEESVRALVETRALVGARGAYRLTEGLPSIQVPATVQAILAARIDRLPPEAKPLLQAASVIGKDVPHNLLRAIADMPEPEFRRALGQLQAGEFVYEASLFPDLEYAFAHALTHEVAYQSLLHDRRRALHARIVDALESTCGDRLPEQIDRLAHHAFRGEAWEKALPYLRQAGARAAARSAHHDAVTCIERALVALQHLPPSREMTEQAIDLRVELRHSLIALGEHGQILGHLREAEALAEDLGDLPRLASIASFIANGFHLIGEHDRAVEAARRALTLATALDDLTLRATAKFYLGQACRALGEYRTAIEALRWNVGALDGEGAPARAGRGGRLYALSHQWLGLCLAEVGEFTEAIEKATTGVRVAEAIGLPEMVMAAGFGLASLYLSRGEFDRAVPLLERGLELAQAGDVPVLANGLASGLGYAHAFAGRLDAAIELIEPARRQAAAMKILGSHLMQVVALSEAYLGRGRIDDASALAGRALEIFRGRGERGHEAWTLHLLGDIAARRTPAALEESEARYRDALALADALGMRPLGARCHLGLGALLRRAGKRDRAGEHLGRAAALFGEMGMRFWLRRAEEELAGG